MHHFRPTAHQVSFPLCKMERAEGPPRNDTAKKAGAGGRVCVRVCVWVGGAGRGGATSTHVKASKAYKQRAREGSVGRKKQTRRLRKGGDTAAEGAVRPPSAPIWQGEYTDKCFRRVQRRTRRGANTSSGANMAKNSIMVKRARGYTAVEREKRNAKGPACRTGIPVGAKRWRRGGSINLQ